VATKLGVSIAEATHTLSEFSGATRRFELKGEVKGITIIDDYAHNPTEIKATLAAARTRFGERPLWAVFQPHTFSRTILLLEQFAAAFDRADHVILLDIFPSREKDDGSVSSADVVARMEHPDARYLGQMTEAITYLQDHLSPGDVLITLGAGDGYKVGETILEK
jgi:UDP-N-acetylmuramate--alanine ligase